MPTISSSTSSPILEPASEHMDAGPTDERNLQQRTGRPGGILTALPRHQRSDQDLSQRIGSPIFRDSMPAESIDPATAYTSEEVDQIVDRLGEYHVRAMQKLHGSVGNLEEEVRGMRGRLHALSADLKTARENNDTRTAAEKARAKDRAISRENKITQLTAANADLLSDLDKTRGTIVEMEESFANTQSRLEALSTTLDRQSRVIAGQTQAMKKERGRIRELKDSHEDAIGQKDAQITDLDRQLDAAKSRSKDLQSEKRTLQAQRDAVTITSSGVTSAKTKALVDSGQQINDRAVVLEELNKKLLSERKTLIATNAENRAEIDRLRGQILSLAKRMGIDPSTS